MFLVFGGYYRGYVGGWGDFKGFRRKFEEAKALVADLSPIDWWEIVELKSMSVVASSSAAPTFASPPTPVSNVPFIPRVQAPSKGPPNPEVSNETKGRLRFGHG